MTEEKKEAKPAVDQSAAFQAAFDFFNQRLFEGKLPKVMLTMSRNANLVGGYFSPKKWFDENKEEIGEIAINANVLKQTGIVKAMSILIHEQVHLWQFAHGKPSRGGYHNREWSDKCKDIGLLPVGPDGQDTGQTIDTDLIEDGLAIKAIEDLPEEDLFPWMSEPLENPDGGGGGGGGTAPNRPPLPKKPGTRTKYTCPACGWNLWGKAGGTFMCMTCNQLFIEMKGGQEDE